MKLIMENWRIRAEAQERARWYRDATELQRRQALEDIVTSSLRRPEGASIDDDEATELYNKTKKELEEEVKKYYPDANKAVDIYGADAPYITVPPDFIYINPQVLRRRFKKAEKFINLWTKQDWAASQWFQPAGYGGVKKDFQAADKYAVDAIDIGSIDDENVKSAHILYALHELGIVDRILRMIKNVTPIGQKICNDPKAPKVFYGKCVKDREIKAALLKEFNAIQKGIEKYARAPKNLVKKTHYQTGVYGLPATQVKK